MSVPAGPEADADVAGGGTGIPLRHVRGTLDVAGQDVAESPWARIAE